MRSSICQHCKYFLFNSSLAAFLSLCFVFSVSFFTGRPAGAPPAACCKSKKIRNHHKLFQYSPDQTFLSFSFSRSDCSKSFAYESYITHCNTLAPYVDRGGGIVCVSTDCGKSKNQSHDRHSIRSQSSYPRWVGEG